MFRVGGRKSGDPGLQVQRGGPCTQQRSGAGAWLQAPGGAFHGEGHSRLPCALPEPGRLGEAPVTFHWVQTNLRSHDDNDNIEKHCSLERNVRLRCSHTHRPYFQPWPLLHYRPGSLGWGLLRFLSLILRGWHRDLGVFSFK